MELKFRNIEENAPVIIYIGHSDMGFDAAKIYEGTKKAGCTPYTMCELLVEDWDRFLTPWPVDNCLKGRSFEGQGKMLLERIENEYIPLIENSVSKIQAIYIAGYSLAGMFALWSLYNVKRLSGAVCCSGSLWYPGFEEYIDNNSFDRSDKLYLSLGRKESKAGNKVMGNVFDITNEYYRRLKESKEIENVVFELNDGGHFTNVEGRIEAGIKWILK